MTEQVTDQLETMILMALDANHENAFQSGNVLRSKQDGSAVQIVDQGKLLRIDEMRPVSSYTGDMLVDDRIVTWKPDLLLQHPAEILGDECEIMMMSGSDLRWFGFQKLRSAPKGVTYLGKPTHWYAMHFRQVTPNGLGDYRKRVIPFDKNGNPLVALVQKNIVCSPTTEGACAVVCASIKEDSHRKNTMLAHVKDATEIKFAVPIDDYKSIFSSREGPYSGNRRKSILHWVKNHLRKSSIGNEVEVKKHLRGIQEFTIDGLKIKISPND